MALARKPAHVPPSQFAVASADDDAGAGVDEARPLCPLLGKPLDRHYRPMTVR